MYGNVSCCFENSSYFIIVTLCDGKISNYIAIKNPQKQDCKSTITDAAKMLKMILALLSLKLSIFPLSTFFIKLEFLIFKKLELFEMLSNNLSKII